LIEKNGFFEPKPSTVRAYILQHCSFILPEAIKNKAINSDRVAQADHECLLNFIIYK